MSAEAEGHVWRKSPYRGTTFAVHLAIADVANDMHHYEFFMSNTELAKKARTTQPNANRVLHRLVADGWLSVVENGSRLPRGIVRYRFEFRHDVPDAWTPRKRPMPKEHRSPGEGPPTYVEPASPPMPTAHTELKREPKTDTRVQRTSAKARIGATDEAEVLSGPRLAKAVADLRDAL